MSQVKKHQAHPARAGRESRNSYAPMGEARFRELIAALSISYEQADAGEAKKLMAREREAQRAVWLAQRDEAIVEIIELMRRYGLTAADLD